MKPATIDLPSLDAAIHHLYNRRATRDAELRFILFSYWPKRPAKPASRPFYASLPEPANYPGSPRAQHLGGHRS